MKIPEKETLRNMIIRHEGWRTEPYYCSEHVRTIGAGWNLNNPLPPEIDAYLKKNGRITDDHINELLDISLRHAWADCRVLFPLFDTDAINNNRRVALVDVVFNMGYNRLRLGFPKFVHSVNTGNWESAAAELKYTDGKKRGRLSDYYRQTKGRAVEIVRMIEEG